MDPIVGLLVVLMFAAFGLAGVFAWNSRPGSRGFFERAPLIRFAAAWTGALVLAGVVGLFLLREDDSFQVAQLQVYARLRLFPQRILQVDLNQYQSFSQYIPAITSPDQGNFGNNACGLLSPAQAVIIPAPGRAGTAGHMQAVMLWMQQIRSHAVNSTGRPTYQNATGIQPAELAHALAASRLVVAVHNRWTLTGLAQALQQGKIVIVDLRVEKQSETPGIQPETFSHYARVLGIDADRQEIYIENTLSQQDGRPYWTVPLADFLQAWQYPETQSTIKPSQVDPTIHEENVTRWAVLITR